MSFVSPNQLHGQGHSSQPQHLYSSPSHGMEFNGMDRFPTRPTSPGPRQPYVEYDQKPSAPHAYSHMHTQSPATMPGVDLRSYTMYLEQQNKNQAERIRQLEAQCALQTQHNLMTTGIAPKALPAYFQPNFRADWTARTEARRALFCSNNRNGISSCSWHASRHQPKSYAPRSAPEGVLNCECTAEEALFEASLASHGVGAYKSGSSNTGNGREPRMDPALRRTLLKLLKRRYGYRDGDFEVDAHTGQWIHGESSTTWVKRKEAGQKDCPPVHAHLLAPPLLQMQSPVIGTHTPPLPAVSPLSPSHSNPQLLQSPQQYSQPHMFNGL